MSAELAATRLSFPYLTVCVSNVNTLKRQVNRRGGSMLEVTEPVAALLRSQGTDPASAQLVADPDGVVSIVLHKFRRSPVLSLTLGCSRPTVTAGT